MVVVVVVSSDFEKVADQIVQKNGSQAKNLV
jgi:hypothetical protein